MIGWVVERSGGLSKSNKCNRTIKGLLWWMYAESVAKRIWLYFVKQFEIIDNNCLKKKLQNQIKINLPLKSLFATISECLYHFPSVNECRRRKGYLINCELTLILSHPILFNL